MLWYHFASEEEGGADDSAVGQVLDTPLSSLPALSAGQAQLLALARALLQAYSRTDSGFRPIILLDEATSSLDSTTERLMLSIIHEELMLKGYTIIMVAHRLGSISAYMREGVDRFLQM